jgi:hypothetical protein
MTTMSPSPSGGRGRDWPSLWVLSVIAVSASMVGHASNAGAGTTAMALPTPTPGTQPPQQTQDQLQTARSLTSPYDYAGLIHVHSDYSDDATGSYESLANAAGAQGLRFVVVTDHNTLQPLIDHRQGWSGGVLMLTGMESSRPEGHLLAVGDDAATAEEAMPTNTLLSAVSRAGGLTFVAHPTHRRWAWRGNIDRRIDGMEILDLADSFEAAPLLAKAAAFAILPFDRAAAYLTLGVHPTSSLRLWDTIGQSRRFVGIYAPDIHQSIEVGGGRRVAFPPAGEIMRLASDHILSTVPFQGEFEADRSILYDAFREGHLYVAIDQLGDATGFMFTAAQDDRLAWMGEEILAGRVTRYSIVLPASAARLRPVIRLLRNGVSIAESQPGADGLDVVDNRQGVFRVEVVTSLRTLLGPGREMTWIYSNPIYARGDLVGD